jgi:hypothetical protein
LDSLYTDDQIRVVTGAVLAGRVRHAERSADTRQIVRATLDFYGSPWYSSVLVDVEEEGGRKQYYARLELIFTATAQMEERGPMVEHECAFVRWYRAIPAIRDPLSSLGCTRLQWWADEGAAEGYEVINLSSISCRQHVLPSPTQGIFYASSILEHLSEV